MERRVLIKVPAEHDGRLSVRVLASGGIDAHVCASASELAQELDRGAGCLLVTEEALTEPVLRVLAAHRAAQPPWSDLPVLVMAKRGADSLEAQRAVENLGNVTMLERPVRTITLISAARSALRARDRQYEMRALSRRKDEFLATLAHELRNPLAPIANAMAIMTRLHPAPQVTPLIAVVERQVSHLKRLVDDLLDVARITNGKLDLQVSATSIARVVTQAMEIAEHAVQVKQHRITVSQPPQEVVLQADHVRVVQGLANLLVNAAKFTPPSGEISLTASVEGSDAVFVVRDSGRGLEEAELERIFDIFEQTRNVGEPTGGLGLGLHLTRAFAAMHGGSVKARSEGRGRGSEFTLRLPVVAAASQSGECGSVPAGSAPPMPRRVLVVDDNEDAAATLEELLALHGIEVSVAHDGAAALDRVRSERPDVVVMDIGMPVMNGYEAADAIRRSAVGEPPILIALTGWGQHADKARAQDAGFDHHLVKPLRIEELLACLSRYATARPPA